MNVINEYIWPSGHPSYFSPLCLVIFVVTDLTFLNLIAFWNYVLITGLDASCYMSLPSSSCD
jgi:hypothetical protein